MINVQVLLSDLVPEYTVLCILVSCSRFNVCATSDTTYLPLTVRTHPELMFCRQRLQQGLQSGMQAVATLHDIWPAAANQMHMAGQMLHTCSIELHTCSIDL